MKIGDIFGSWVVLSPPERGSVYSRCSSCGAERYVRCDSLRSGRTRSCGCSRQTHGMASHPFYRLWVTLRARQALCPEWHADLKTFVSGIEALPKYVPGTGQALRKIQRGQVLGPLNAYWQGDDHLPLYRLWRRLTRKGLLCLEWAEDFNVFKACVGLVRGYGSPEGRLHRENAKAPFGPNNVRWLPKIEHKGQEELYDRWRALPRQDLCPEWASDFKAYAAAIEALPGYAPGKVRIGRLDPKTPFGPTNITCVPPGRREHPLYNRWYAARSSGVLCPEWHASLEAFVSYVEALPGYSPEAVLRRINKNKRTGPGNVVWVEK